MDESVATDYLLSVPQSLRRLCPEQTDHLDTTTRAVWQNVDPVLLELVRLRIAMLIGHPSAGVRSPWVSADALSDEKVAALPRWPQDELFDERERDCLSFTEQFVMDVANLSDADAAAAGRHFTAPDFYAFVNAVYLADFGQRLEMATHALLPEVAK
jgi:alkylhydroperoxidase family enzyme